MRSPSQAVPRKECAKPCSGKSRLDEIETSAHTVQSASRERNLKKTHSLLPLPTTGSPGERVSDFSAEGQSPGTSEGFFSCQEMLFAKLHNVASRLGFNCVS